MILLGDNTMPLNARRKQWKDVNGVQGGLKMLGQLSSGLEVSMSTKSCSQMHHVPLLHLNCALSGVTQQ